MGGTQMQALIFDIQRNSYVDGPGIRTTIFFKGCNLKCKWCHNPESQHLQKEILFYKNKCTGCGMCFAVCPEGVIWRSDIVGADGLIFTKGDKKL